MFDFRNDVILVDHDDIGHDHDGGWVLVEEGHGFGDEVSFEQIIICQPG